MDSSLFARALEKGLDAQGASAELNPGVSPVHVVTQESEHPEFRYLRVERYAGAVATQGASVGNFSYVILSNPANSGALVMLRQIIMTNRGAATIEMQQREGLIANLAGVANIAGRLLDLRYGPPGTIRSTGLIGVATPAAHFTGGFSTRFQLPAGTSLILDSPTILPPGTWVAIAGNVANQETVASFRWIERAAESGELQGSGV